MLRKTLGLFLIFFSALGNAHWATLWAAPGEWVTQQDLIRLVDENALPPAATVDVSVAGEDERLSPAACPAALFSNSENRKLWGRTLLKVQCLGAETAPFYVYVDVKVWAPVLVVKGQIQRGDSISADDVEFRTMNVAELKQGWVTELSDLDNKQATRALWPGTTLTHDLLKGRPLLQYGDSVKIMVKGPGFQVAGSGTAMERAEKGDVVKIKTVKGKILHGVAVDKTLVEVTL